MLRHLLYPIVFFALWVFFRKIDVRGRDQTPRGRPVIFVANHPNVMLDSLILALCIPGRYPRFLGKSTLFKRALYAFFLRRLGVIPVARTQDPDSRMAGNQNMLRAACQSLLDGHSLVLFPEGLSHAAIKVRDLKPGGARIALRTEDEADGCSGVCIVPVGLTYSDPGVFRSHVDVHFGEPIEVSTFLPTYRANHREGAGQLTELMHERLRALTWHIEDPDLETGIRDLAAIYTEQIARELPDSAELSSHLRAGQELIQGVAHFAETDPGLVQSLASRLRAHHRKLRRLKLEPYSLAPDAGRPGVGHALLALILAPVALYGFLNNAVPYLLPRLFVRPYSQTPQMIGTIKLSVGAVVFPVYYLLRTVIVYLFAGQFTTLLFGVSLPLRDPTLALVYGCTLPVSGLVTLYYNELILQKWPLWQGLVAPRRRHYYLKRLVDERSLLLGDLDAIKEQYMAHLDSLEKE